MLMNPLAGGSITEPVPNLHNVPSWATMQRCALVYRYILGACRPYPRRLGRESSHTVDSGHSNGQMQEREALKLSSDKA